MEVILDRGSTPLTSTNTFNTESPAYKAGDIFGGRRN